MRKAKMLSLLIFFLFTVSWSQAQVRNKISLNSGWEFVLNDDQAIANLKNADWKRVSLPHTWNAEDVIDEIPGYHQGIGWYRKSLAIGAKDSGKIQELYFEGVCNKAEVFVNGQKVNTHYGGFTGFRMDITPYLKYDVPNTILVKADNSKYLKDTVPPFSADFNLMGGIYRDVWLITEHPVHFVPTYGSQGVFFTTPQVSVERAVFRIKGSVSNPQKKSNLRIHYQLYDKDKLLVESEENLSATDTFNLGGLIHHPHLWTPEDPYLYQVLVSIRDAEMGNLDEISFAAGFKWVGIGPGLQFLLNGKPYKLRGAARHQDYDKMGTAMTDPMHFQDISLMKAMGCNFIRIAHYPQDPSIYEACDQLGLLAWNEIPVVDRVVNNKSFFQNSANMMHEMIAQNGNHACLAIWGFQNEVRNLDSSDLAHAEQMYGIARAMDPERLTAMAFETNLDAPFFKNPLLAKILAIPDIIGYNVYQGWYRGGLEQVGPFLDTLHQLNPSKPILISEFGAGSSVSIHSFAPKIFDFSEEYQCLFQAPYLEHFQNHSWMIGVAIWNFIDFQRDGREDVQPNYNNKGMVTTDRKPKDVYYFYRARWSGQPFVYITGKNWTSRYFFSSGQAAVQMPVTIFSNRKLSRIWVQKAAFPVVETSKGVYKGIVRVNDGHNQLFCETETDGCKDVIDIHCFFIDTTAPFKNFPPQGLHFNTGQTGSFFEDKTSHEVWLPDKPFSKLNWGYVGGTVYNSWPNPTWNGVREGINRPIAETDNEPVFQTFVQGLTAWKAMVPAGNYRVRVFLSEPFTAEQRNSLPRIFNIELNGAPWVNQLNIEKEYGIQRAVILDKEITVRKGEGLTISFTPSSGKTLLNGVSIQKL